ncbi:hypothetical protein PFISCL1PPCAC_24576, partial [Pristionchus fissidentatus]
SEICKGKSVWDDFDSYYAVGDLVLCAALAFFIWRSPELREKYMNFVIVVILHAIRALGVIIFDAYWVKGCTISLPFYFDMMHGYIVYALRDLIPTFIMGALLWLRFTVSTKTIPHIF